MANFIHTLKAENEALKRQVAAMEISMNDFRAFLQSPKFQGPDAQWIGINDVWARLRVINDAGLEALEKT